MQNRALAKAGDDDSDTFEHWLSREGLTSPPWWLADFHGPKPLDERLWVVPQKSVSEWVEATCNNDFLAELGLVADDGTVIVSSGHDTRSRNFRSTARVHSALVSPDTAGALVRALQTVDNPWTYIIPPAGDEREIVAPPYKLIGWLAIGRHELGIDEHDPLRYEVGAVACTPSEKTVAALNLEFVYNGQARWVEANRRNPVFVYEAWGDNRGDEHDDRFLYNDTVRSSGWQLRIQKEALSTFLNEMRLDLIVEVAITRRNKGHGYSRDDEEGTKEAQFDRVLLRRDGTIEAAEGRLGTWTIPRP
jgi:hypothetical protein